MNTDQKIDMLVEELRLLRETVGEIHTLVGAKVRKKAAPLVESRAGVVRELFQYLVDMPQKKKDSANFPKELRDKHDFSKGGETLRAGIVPLSALVARASQRTAFKPVEGEATARDGVEAVLADAGLVVKTLDGLGLKRGSSLRVVLTKEKLVEIRAGEEIHKPAVKVEKRVAPVAAEPKPEIDEQEQEQEQEQEERPPVAYVSPTAYKSKIRGFGDDAEDVVVPVKKKKKVRRFKEEPTTVDTVDEPQDLTDTTGAVIGGWRDHETGEIDPTLPEDDDTDGWGEDEQPEEDPFALFALSGKQQKESEKISKKVIDLSWGGE
jgi:hypothetical protein